MAEVWMVATGDPDDRKVQRGDPMARKKLIFDNEESATKTAELIDELRRKLDRHYDACLSGDASWGSSPVKSVVEILGSKIKLGRYTVVCKFEVHS
jgi:hypothetical protein